MIQNPWHIERCRARDGGCHNALADLSVLTQELEAVIGESGWGERIAAGGAGRKPRPHHLLRIALAACPNACSKPQIRDLGIIASVRPNQVLASCTGCGLCVKVCREAAIDLKNNVAVVDSERCVGCGACGAVCPPGAMDMGPLQFRILVGGRLGRHPAWAVEMPATVSREQLVPTVARLLEITLTEALEQETFGETARRLGTALWRRVRA